MLMLALHRGLAGSRRWAGGVPVGCRWGAGGGVPAVGCRLHGVRRLRVSWLQRRRSKCDDFTAWPASTSALMWCLSCVI